MIETCKIELSKLTNDIKSMKENCFSFSSEPTHSLATTVSIVNLSCLAFFSVDSVVHVNVVRERLRIYRVWGYDTI